MISVIIPTLNEEICIEDTVHPARDGGDIEIIIADGGSIDSTLSVVQHFSDKIISSPKGRAKQMNAGVAAADGSILLFLHADTILPVGWVEMIEKALENKVLPGGLSAFQHQAIQKG